MSFSVGGHLLGLGQVVGELLERRVREASRRPQIRGEVPVRGLQRLECCLGEVCCRPGVSTGAGEAVRDAGESHHLLHDWRAYDAGAARSRDQARSH